MSDQDHATHNLRQSPNQEELEQIRQRLDGLDEFFWVFDPQNDCFVYVGSAYARIWERARNPLTRDAAEFFDAIHPEDRPRVREAYRAERTSTYDEIYRVCRPDGSVRVVRDRAFPQLDLQQRVKLITGLVSDLSDIVLAPAGQPGHDLPVDERPTMQLDNTQKRYRALFVESADAAVLLDGHGYFIEANLRAAQLLGYQPHELVRMHFSSFFADDTLASAVAFFNQVLGGRRGNTTIEMRRHDQSAMVTEVAATLLHFGPEYVVQICLREAPAREKIAHELEATRDQLAQVQKMELIGQIAGGVAHDFNNLLSIIMGFAEVLDLHLEGDTEGQQSARKIQEAGESAALLVRRLLTIARRETPQPEVLDPRALLQRVCPLLERALPDNVKLRTRLAEGLWKVSIDQVEFEQIIMNLVINAGDAMPKGGEVLVMMSNFTHRPTTPSAPSALPYGHYLHLCVQDSGIGMDERTRQRIFEPFFTTKPRARGTGLGLATVHNLVTRNRGVIQVASAPGNGTTFDLFFPQCES